MKRAARRRAERQRRNGLKIVAAIGAGRPVVGLTDACADCNANGSLTPLPGGAVLGEVWHAHGCPAAAGVTKWRPAS
ncbi:hypothetical protein KN246_15810 [Mycobacterium intracellulare]|uniref:hypothetical protein n=1 Tax=Mycobacterium intracellulare TaxID=1767 RepID=UPI001E48B1FA|nr:hypothetical protein [Mycobacterium intracellulare]UGT94855.1 hypothetical protein LTQ55_13730 [Mycobacterium intracellulare]UQB95731.1 hypothetical protein KN246_15810 [Mycobacterium intracellulare]